ncbi:hypothetical protein COEREDRAFT_79767 [Coemansia reversa NRRL 1564]|uniref:Uncharacterized protein n=1 Tax=Coemansia reversa (strain ATCC 12441 / NRRL 1564) TaxID=763665 RepID=A0A2G5BGV3_COERN|nr:hypothetical protein COEREDRAFT_79767 [Coemansia reversa NRRL 1564]|eukprot:PIA18250.1 hypothetical protein COEREDRAFT_79767 [Coemansia reversa NRRL 1564]
MASTRFVEASLTILTQITGPLSQNALCQSEDLASKVDSLEHTTTNGMSRIADSLYHLQTIVEDNRRTLENSSNNLQVCVKEHELVQESLHEIVVLARNTLDAIDSRKDLEKEEKSKYIREMDKRNEDFDKRLRQEHHEFTQMHAQRLSKVLQDQL